MIFAIEINGPKNECALFLGRRLRGRWDYSRVMHRDKSNGHKRLATNVQVIPGMCIEVDTDKRAGRIFDALAETRDGRAIFDRMKAVIDQHSAEFDGNIQPHPTSNHELTFDELKDWAWQMSELVTQGYATVIAGTMPSKEAIRGWPGKRTRDPNNTGRQEVDLKKYVDEVPVGPERELSAAGSASSSRTSDGSGKGGAK